MISYLVLPKSAPLIFTAQCPFSSALGSGLIFLLKDGVHIEKDTKRSNRRLCILTKDRICAIICFMSSFSVFGFCLFVCFFLVFETARRAFFFFFFFVRPIHGLDV